MERDETDRAVMLGTLGDALAQWAAVQPGQSAIRFEGRVIDYAELNRRANRVARALAGDGLGKGDRIAYLGKNSDLAVELVLGAARAGVVFVPIIWRLAGEEIAYILGDSGAKLLFVGDALEQSALAAMQASGTDVPVIGMDCTAPQAGWRDFAAWRDAQDATDPAVAVSRDDVVIQLYTSGTTGKPKGVMLTHANGTSMRPLIDAAGLDWMVAKPGESVLIAMPYAHIAGVGGALGAILAGQELIVTREFDPGVTLEIIEQHRLGRMFLVPAALAILLQHPRAAATDFSSIRNFSYGASPIPLDLLRQGVDVLQCDFSQMYGMTETWGTIVVLPPEDHRPEGTPRMKAAGKALPGVELAILDEAGNHLPSGAVGEVAIRSPANMIGYWNKPEETARTLIGDGWLRSGDAGLIDADGYLFLQDRIKDMIITGAENVYPAEVESAIYGHPDVADVAVIGVPDARWGEAVKAIVVPRPGASPDPADIIAHARRHIAGFKCPKSVDFIDTLPRNPSGKILRRQLREPYWEGLDRRVN